MVFCTYCCTQYASKFGKLSSGHRAGKGQFSFQSQRKAMPKDAQVQFNHSVVSDSVTPWTAAHQASLFIINSWSLLKVMSTESVMLSNHLILCHSLLLPPSIFPNIGVFSNESVLITWCFKVTIPPNYYFLKNYLVVLGLSSGMWDLVPWPGIKCRPLALGVQSLSHWITREVSPSKFFFVVQHSSFLGQPNTEHHLNVSEHGWNRLWLSI